MGVVHGLGVSVLSTTLKNTEIHVPCEKYCNVKVLQTVKTPLTKLSCEMSLSSFFSRQQRIAEIQKLQQASKFGDVREISAQDYVDEVNKAGKGVWVVLHLYKSGYPFVIILSPFTVNSEM